MPLNLREPYRRPGRAGDPVVSTPSPPPIPAKKSAAAAVPVGPASVIARLGGHSGGALVLAFSPDRGMLASSGRDGTSRLWDFGSGSPGERAMLGASGRRVQSLAFSVNGQSIAAGSGALDGIVWVFDLTGKAPREAFMLRGARGAVNALAFSPDGTLVAGAGEDRALRIWEPTPGSRGEPRAHLAGHTGPIRAVAFAPDGQSCVSGSDDSTARLWTVNRIRSTEKAALQHPSGVTALAYTPDGQTLLTGGRDGVIRLWNVATTKPDKRAELPAQPGGIRLLVIPRDGQSLVSVADGPRAVHWDLQAGRPLREWGLPAGTNAAVGVTGDGRYLAMGRESGQIEVYRIAEKRA
jgi:WD40 repeat protein